MRGGSPSSTLWSNITIDATKDMQGLRLQNVGASVADTDAPRARAGDILSGRFPYDRMPDDNVGLLLMFQGAGVSPAGRWRVTSGSYTGDSTANRAIAHGQPITPKIVFIFNHTIVGYFYVITTNLAAIREYQLLGANNEGQEWAVTAMDADNFYVGNALNYQKSANVNTPETYYWVVIG